MRFIATTGNGSMDTYARHLAESLKMPVIWTDIYENHDFGLPLLAQRSLSLARRDARFASQLRRLGVPVHLPNQHFGRYAAFLNEPYVITVHDLIRYLDMRSHGLPLIERADVRDKLYLRADAVGIRRATAVIANSEATKRDIVRHLAIPEDRVFVTHLAVDHSHFRPVDRRVADFPYLLFVGTEQPRKNFGTLLEAFSALKRDTRLRDLRLVKVGSAGDRDGSLRRATAATITRLGLERDVLMVGRVPYKDLPAYYSGAQCFVMPSLAEGFGYPSLEAMACGSPVVVSDCDALTEVAQDAAEIADASSVESLAESLCRVLLDPARREQLRVRGLRRAAGFTTARMAKATRAVYEAVPGLGV